MIVRIEELLILHERLESLRRLYLFVQKQEESPNKAHWLCGIDRAGQQTKAKIDLALNALYLNC